VTPGRLGAPPACGGDRSDPGLKKTADVSVVVETYPDTSALAAAAGDRLVEAITGAIAARGKALIVLTGGGTGIGLLEHVRAHDDGVDWAKVHVFWGDERFVPAADDERNEKQAREALIDHIDIPAGNVHAMAASDGEFGEDLDAAAADYAEVLAEIAESSDTAPVFDVHLLGMGGEGHINSLFPHSPATLETEKLVVGVEDSPKPPPRRITLTLPAVQHSREVWLVVGGEAKADAVAAAIGGATPADVPAAGGVGREATVWLLDAAAASKLND
jgi:6-phosphogluconolactonase